jgi:phage/plasmid primase-like uncharacterized protein
VNAVVHVRPSEIERFARRLPQFEPTTPERIRQALAFIDASDRDVWVRMGMAVKSELGEEGFDVWDAWSKTAPNYDPRSAREVWRSIRPDGGVTIATLFHEARARGWRDTGPPLVRAGAVPQRDPEQAAREQAEIEAERQQAREWARSILKASRPGGDDHTYLVRKQVRPVETLREIDADQAAELLGYRPQCRGEPLTGRLLVVPIKQGDALASLEMIDEHGRKAALRGRGTRAGGYWATERMPEGEGEGLTLLLGEGVATALSAAQATGHLGIAALSCGNLGAVARAMRGRYPRADIVLLADLIRDTGEPDRHALEAARAAGGRVAVPGFGEGREPHQKDMNDLFIARGADAVARVVRDAKAPASEPVRTAGAVGLLPETEEPSLEPLPLPEALARARRLLSNEADEQARPDTDYPIDALGPLSDACRTISTNAQVQAGLVGQSLLATAALLVSSRWNVRHIDGSVKPLNVYALSVSLSGSGKDQCDSVVTSAVREWQRRANAAYQLELAACESAKASRKKGEPPPEPPIAPHRLCSDMTIEGLRRSFAEGIACQGVFSTEGAAVLSGHGFSADHRAKTAAALCGLWDRGHLSVLRAGGGRFERYGLRLSAHLLIQPAALGEVLHDPLLSHIGLWPRFLLSWPPINPPRRFMPWDAASDPHVASFWRACTEHLQQECPSDCTELPALSLSPKAAQAFGRFFEEMEQAAQGELQSVRPFALRATEHAVRIAGVLTAWRGWAVVQEDDAERGIALARYSVQQWRQALEEGKADPAVSDALALYGWLARQPGFTARRRDVLRGGPSRLRNRDALEIAISRLTDAGLVVVEGGDIAAIGIESVSPTPPLATPATPATLTRKPNTRQRVTTVAEGCDTLATPCDTCDTQGDTDSEVSQLSQLSQGAGGGNFGEVSQLSQPVANTLATPQVVDIQGKKGNLSQLSQLSQGGGGGKFGEGDELEVEL